MLRLLVSLSLVALLLWSCGPDPYSPTCSGPNFRVVLKLTMAPLPADTVVHVTYAGSAEEIFRLSEPNAKHKVVFCEVADDSGLPLDASTSEATGAGGAAGAASSSNDPARVVPALSCKLWTAGYAQLEVSGSGFATVKYDLAPQDGLCTVDEAPFVLDSPDAG